MRFVLSVMQTMISIGLIAGAFLDTSGACGGPPDPRANVFIALVGVACGAAAVVLFKDALDQNEIE